MRRFGYPQSFSTGVIAAGGTLGAMLPPSTVLAVYAILTQQDIGKLFMAGVLPGLLAMAMYVLTIAHHRPRPARVSCRPAPSKPWRERVGALRLVWAPLAALRVRDRRPLRRLLHADRGRRRRRHAAPSCSACCAASSTAPTRAQALLQATRTAAAVFTVLIGALLFGYFLTITQTPQKLTEFLTGLGVGRYGVLALIMLMYLVLGCLMDAMAMIILTVPIIFPVDHRARLRSDLVRRDHRHDGRARPDPSAGGHERVRDQERRQGRQLHDHLQGRAAVRGDRHRAA